MFFFSAADPVEKHCKESEPGYRIETHRTPTGDGNSIIKFEHIEYSAIETHRTPTGDGNYAGFKLIHIVQCNRNL